MKIRIFKHFGGPKSKPEFSVSMQLFKKKIGIRFTSILQFLRIKKMQNTWIMFISIMRLLKTYVWRFRAKHVLDLHPKHRKAARLFHFWLLSKVGYSCCFYQ